MGPAEPWRGTWKERGMRTPSNITSARALGALLRAVLAASVPVSLAACGGGTDDPAGDGGANGDTGYQCQPQSTTTVIAYTKPPRCDAGVDDAAVPSDAGADASLDASGGDAGVPCADNDSLDCYRICSGVGGGGGGSECRLLPDQPGKVECTSHQYCGRRPAGLAPLHHHETGLAAYLTEGAHLEAASIEAFHVLARELAAHDAPACLIVAAKQAARDEARHARVMFALARREGAATKRASRQSVRATRARELEVVAIENAIEGCVRESYGALLALRQAEQAEDSEIRQAMIGIAEDEVAHAGLAWDVARWASRHLAPPAVERVARARAAAIRDLEREATTTIDPTTARAAGLPDHAEALALVRGLGVALETYSAA
jgi:hypothetical protein